MSIKIFNTYIIISPYFFVMLIWCFLTSKMKGFLLCFLALFIHECGHLIFIYALKEKVAVFKILPLGFTCKLMNQTRIDSKKLIKILVAGPAVSIITAGIFLFWTQDFAIINLTIGLVNLLPLYELDGMRIVNILIENRVYR